jgi:hypothetical protein
VLQVVDDARRIQRVEVVAELAELLENVVGSRTVMPLGRMYKNLNGRVELGFGPWEDIVRHVFAVKSVVEMPCNNKQQANIQSWSVRKAWGSLSNCESQKQKTLNYHRQMCVTVTVTVTVYLF